MNKNRNNFRKTIIYLGCFLFPAVFWSQIKISESIQWSKTAKHNINKLYYIDFWATWCGPCIHVSKYLSILQKQQPDDFYILSLTDENPETVTKFLEKHPTDLAVAVDYNRETFQANNIRTLPYGILLNADGKTLWKGHPADLKSSIITRFLRRNHHKASVDEMFILQPYEKDSLKENYQPIEDFEYTLLNDETTDDELQIRNNDEFIELKGQLQDILAYVFKVYKSQIHIAPKLNKQYHIYIKNQLKAPADKSLTILKNMQLEFNSFMTYGKTLVLDMTNAFFWDTMQFDWGPDSAKYLIDDTQIQADNVRFADITYQLAELLEMPVVITHHKHPDKEKHDWQIHYKFYDLMQSDLHDNYGIKAQKKITQYPVYLITKKIPR